jgi:hypothetical protein
MNRVPKDLGWVLYTTLRNHRRVNKIRSIKTLRAAAEKMMPRSKNNFANSFKSEDHLRQSLRTLLAKIPGVYGVVITHGSQEVGKDLVFYVRDFLGHPQLHACVVKLTKIDGSTKKTGAREVLTQATEALDTPHVNSEGQDESVVRVLVVSPHHCPPATMNSIRGALKHRAGQVKFLCGDLLMDEFGKYWQDFLLFESSALHVYVASVTRALTGKDPIHFLLQNQQLLTGELDSLEARYVPQGFKKNLQVIQFNADPDELRFKALQSSFSLVELRERVDSFHLLKKLFESSSFLITFDISNSQEILDALENVGRLAIDEWQERFQAERLRVEAVGQRRMMRHDAIVIITGERFASYEGAFDSADLIIHSLVERLKANNHYIRGVKKNQIDLHATSFKEFCQLQDCAREVPELFTCEDRPDDFLLDKSSLLSQRKFHLLITAPAGYGKTSFCKIHAIRDAIGLGNKLSDVIPVYISLHNLATAHITDYTVFLDSIELRAILDANEPAKSKWMRSRTLAREDSSCLPPRN